MAKTNKNRSYHRAADKPLAPTPVKYSGLQDAMSIDDVVNDEARIRYRAKRAGYCVLQTRGLEKRRHEQCGIGIFMLLNTMAWPCPLPR